MKTPRLTGQLSDSKRKKKVQLQFRTKPTESHENHTQRFATTAALKGSSLWSIYLRLRSVQGFCGYCLLHNRRRSHYVTEMSEWVSDASNSGIPILTQSSLDLSRGFLFFFFSEYLYQAPSFLHGLQLNRSTAYYYIHFKWQKYHFSGIRRDLT